MDSFFNFKTDKVEVNISGSEQTSVKIAKNDILMMIDSSFIYPKEKSVIDKEVKDAQLQLKYTCECNLL